MKNFLNCWKKQKKRPNPDANVKRVIKALTYSSRHDALTNKALTCTQSGISEEKLCNHEVIVSLTTYGRRLHDVAITIESIMQGSMKPNRIVLWLGEEMQNAILPVILRNQQKRGLEISLCKDICSYTKLIPTLCKYPEACIITIDDDVLYDYDLVEKLVNDHIKHPKDIVANRIHRIVLGEDARPLSYMQWKWCDTPKDKSPLNFFTGVGGVLYPPHSLSAEVMNVNVFLDICKFADDVWFNAMALMNSTKVRKCYTHDVHGEDYLVNDSVQDMGLWNVNTGERCENDIQLHAVFEKYNLWDKLVE